MITEFQIECFKSFGSPPQRLTLGKLNVLVGANASGKSNLIAGLRFIKNAMQQNVDFAAYDLGGFGEVRNKILRERTRPKPVRFLIRGDSRWKFHLSERPWNMDSYEYELVLDVRTGHESAVVKYERLKVRLTSGNDSEEFRMERDDKSIKIVDPVKGGTLNGGTEETLQVPDEESNRLAVGVGFYALPMVLLKREIDSWRFFNISPNVAREPYKEVSGTVLGTMGENLSVVLNQIKKDKSRFAAIIDGLRTAVPGFKDIKLTRLPVEGKLAFQIVEERIRGTINPSAASDGTIRLLALLVIMTLTDQDPFLVALEEPENGVHPHLLPFIAEVLKQAAEDRQLFVTTHSPDLLDSLEPEQVFLCEKVQGFTRIVRASDIEHIQQFRKRFRLGELWVQGTLGGIV